MFTSVLKEAVHSHVTAVVGLFGFAAVFKTSTPPKILETIKMCDVRMSRRSITAVSCSWTTCSPTKLPLHDSNRNGVVIVCRIWTGCDYICSAYDDGQDSAFYMCHDQIASLVTASVSGPDSMDAVLGCQVHAIRISWSFTGVFARVRRKGARRTLNAR